MNRRVVVTGLGVVSSIGIGKEEFWKNLIQGTSGISKVSSFDPTAYGRNFGGEIKNFNPLKFMEEREAKRMGRASQLAVAATELALLDSKVDIRQLNPDKLAILLGTTMGETSVFEILNKAWFEKGLDKVDPFLVGRTTANLLSVNLGIHYGLGGINLVIPTACAAGNYAIGYGYDLIKEGKIDLAIAGGADTFSRIAFTGFSRLYAMSPDICQPFDKNRKGMLLGEGSAVLILEPLEIAEKSDVPIYAEVLGYGLSCDAHHMTIPSDDGIARCMENALNETGIRPEEVNYISAHGTGTVQNDKNECAAIKKIFGGAYKKVAVSSIKSMLGHCMGAASAIEAVSCCLAVSEDIVPPTINYQTPDPDCDIDCVPNEARETQINIALNNAYAFGGNNACVAFKKYAG
jgi:3-oxoacyl-[acyl-carrier-protein] synthase II